MITVLYIVAGYLIVGILFLIIFDLLTKSVRQNLSDTVTQAQAKISSSSPVIGGFAGPMGQLPPLIPGRKITTVALLLTTWLVWPIVLVGYLRDRGGE